MKTLFELFKEAWRLETKSLAGRMNLVSMIAALAATSMVTFIPILEAVVRIFQKNYTSNIPAVQLLIVFCLANICCVGLLVVLERGKD